jgi:hypothetical protein
MYTIAETWDEILPVQQRADLDVEKCAECDDVVQTTAMADEMKN